MIHLVVDVSSFKQVAATFMWTDVRHDTVCVIPADMQSFHYDEPNCVATLFRGPLQK
jgi:hypothetical protein